MDKNGQRFTDELQPRDKVSQAIFAQMEKEGSDCVEEGYDPCKEPVPVVPAQHYFMGGIKVDLGSRTSMKRLYACGETSCNGVHGKNRLASNSLLESLVFARRAADDILFGTKTEFRCTQVDIRQYEDREQILSEYHAAVRNEIERVKNSHE